MKDTRRWILLNPGPVNVTPSVRNSLLGPDLCHREPEFASLLSGIRGKLLSIFGVARTHSAAVLTGSGTLAVEAMLSSYGAPDRKVLVLSNGVYGERLAAILAAHALPHSVLSAPVGSFPAAADIARALDADASIRALALVHHETSSGMLNPLEEVVRLARRRGKSVLVDAVSSLGAERVPVKDIDLCAGSAGKCLHGYPGVAFVLVSRKIRPLLKKKRRSSVYMDLGSILDSEDAGSPPFTPAVQLFYALDAALNELKKEGLSRRVASYASKSAQLQAGLVKLGVRFLVEESRRSHVLTAAWLPENTTYERLHAALKKARFVIYAGQSSLKDRVFRLSNLGDVRAADIDRLLDAIGKTLGGPRPAPRAIVLAAGVGKRFGERTRALPKCLLPLGKGETLLSRYLDAFRRTGVREVVIVVGHLEGLIRRACRRHGRGLKVRFVRNKDYRRGSVLSLYRASKELDREVLVMDADVFFPAEALDRLLAAPGSAFLVDPRSRITGEEMILTAKDGRPWHLSKKPDPALPCLGEATGIVKFARTDALELKRVLADFYRRGILDVEYEDAYCRLMKNRRIGTVGMDGLFWSEIDFEEDLEKVLSVS